MATRLKKKKNSYVQEDTTTSSVEHMLKDRIPWLSLGLLGGLLTTVIVSNYEAILYADVRLAFFIPIIVYLSDAVGSQTETIYIRAIAKTKVHFLNYLLKESLVGLSLGVLFGLCLGGFAGYWLHSAPIAFTIGLATMINLTISPILAVTIPSLIRRQHSDPALGAGPVATIIQDLLSLLIFFFIASVVIFI
jgi:magnesium transporter